MLRLHVLSAPFNLTTSSHTCNRPSVFPHLLCKYLAESAGEEAESEGKTTSEGMT